MVRKLTAAVIFCAAPLMHAQSPRDAVHYDRHNVAEILGFETRGSGDLPAGWSGNPTGTVILESDVVQSGSRAIRLDRSAHPAGSFSTVTSGIPMDFTGRSLELRGFLRTSGVSGFAGLWMREDGEAGPVQFDNMQHRQLAGTHDWQEFTIVLPLDEEANHLVFGALLAGSGIVWVDGLQLLVDGEPVAKAPQRAPEQVETDRAFDQGSGIQLTELTPLQIGNLAMLGRVWGFLKYHDPVVTAGKRRWDYDLFRLLPSVLAASNRAASNEVLAKWIDSLGAMEMCTDCVSLDPARLKLKPDIGWINDAEYLGVPLSRRMQSVYRNRVRNQQYYVSLAPHIENPVFHHEPDYRPLRFPDAGYQLLALYRLWSIVEYWAPDRDVVGEDWENVLSEFIPRVMLAKDKDAYAREMMALIAEIHDTHANLWSSLSLRPPVGACRLPVNVRFIGRSAVVTGYTSEGPGKDSGLERGDRLTTIDGIPFDNLVANWAPLYADSNEAARMRDMAANLTSGNCEPVHLEVRRNDATVVVSATRLDASTAGSPSKTHDLPGPTFRMLSKDIAYLKLSSVKVADVPRYIEQARSARGLIVDIRNYPAEFVVFALGSLLVRQPTPFAEFSSGDLSNPGAFRINHVETLTPAEPHYDGKVVILEDEVSVSQAEYTAMALQAAPHTVVIGSTTAGADGDVSAILLPGGLRTMISGLGVFYPDGAPTQRVGIHIDIEVRPTIAGIRAGRDEVLETAILEIVPGLPSSELDKMARTDGADSQSGR
jgi:C-terminal processing protease CtpA/Prc